jgi:ABC-type transporter Mla MlaB component
MLRVTPIQTGNSTTLKLEGSLSGPWVEELRRCWAKLAAEKVAVEVDLSALNFLDAKGTTLLLQMQRQGSRLFGSSPFVHDLLHTEELVRSTKPRKSSKKEN